MIAATPVGPAFNYQGQLKFLGTPENRPVDFIFTLWDGPGPGANQIGVAQTFIGLMVNNGLFDVELNAGGEFGPNPFNGDARWVEITVDGVMLAPRQPLRVVPYVQHVINAPPGFVPSRAIIKWSGPITSIPKGWALCNGMQGTPDLQDKFIVGAGSTYVIDDIGGTPTHTHDAGSYSATSHTHMFSGDTGNGSNVGKDHGGAENQYDAPQTPHHHSYSGTTSAGGGGSVTGVSASASSLPPFYALAYIMKL